MNATTTTTAPVTATYKGFTLELAQGAANPVILIKHPTLSKRSDHLLEVVASPAVARRAVDRITAKLVAAAMPAPPRRPKPANIAEEVSFGLADSMARHMLRR